MSTSRKSSLTTRVTLFALLIFVASVWLLAYYVSRMLREDLQRQLGLHQFSTVSFVAKELNEHLGDRAKALELLGDRMALAVQRGNEAAQAALEDQPVLSGLFSGGVFITGEDGRVVAEVPQSNTRIGLSYLDRPPVGPALREGRSTIGPPVIGREPAVPVFGIAIPLRDGRHSVIGALVGVVALQQAEFLDHLTQSRYGKSGGFYLAAAKERLIIAATDRQRILQSLPAAGEVPAIDRFVDGYEGSQVHVNPDGVEVLSSAKHLANVDWSVSASIPTEEAFAPIRELDRRLLIATFVLTLLAGALTGWMITRQGSPVLNAVHTPARLASADDPPRPLPIARPEEIGQLVKGFNLLLGKLIRREDALRESHEFVQGVLDSLPSQIAVIDRAGGIVAINAAWRRFSLENSRNPGTMAPNTDVGANYLGVCGEPCVDGTDEGPAARDGIRAVLEGQVPEFRLEYPCHSPQEQRWFMMTATPLGSHVNNAVVVHSNITERKQLEDQIRQLAFYDSLTSLPNRRLLMDRLSQTIATAKRSGRHGALMFIDLDNFKPVNDTYGHEVGDLLLIEAASRLRHCVRESDTVARLGGDEFVVVVSQLDVVEAVSQRQAEALATKLFSRLSEPYRLLLDCAERAEHVIEHRCSASIGIALFDGERADPESILNAADAAMYQSKTTGCGAIRVAGTPPAALVDVALPTV